MHFFLSITLKEYKNDLKCLIILLFTYIILKIKENRFNYSDELNNIFNNSHNHQNFTVNQTLKSNILILNKISYNYIFYNKDLLIEKSFKYLNKNNKLTYY